MRKKTIIPILIFTLSMLGSLAFTQRGIQMSFQEVNPIMKILVNIHPIVIWWFGLGMISFVWIVYLMNKNRIKKCHLVGYWGLALILLINFVRELLLMLSL